MNGLPMTNSASQDPIFSRDHPYAADQIPPLRRFITTAPGAFATLGTPLAAGRDLTWTDIHEKRKVVLVSENFASEYWGSARNAIGKQIRSNPNDAWSEIVGVAGDIRHYGADKKPPSTVYWPLKPSNSMAFMIRTPCAGTESLFTEVRQTVWSANPGLPITDMRTMQQIYDRSMSRTSTVP